MRADTIALNQCNNVDTFNVWVLGTILFKEIRYVKMDVFIQTSIITEFAVGNKTFCETDQIIVSKTTEIIAINILE